MAVIKNIPLRGENWKAFLHEFTNDDPAEIRSDIVFVLDQAQIISITNDYYGSIILPVLKGLYRGCNFIERENIKVSIPKVVDLMIQTKKYNALAAYVEKYRSLKHKEDPNVDYVAKAMTELANELKGILYANN